MRSWGSAVLREVEMGGASCDGDGVEGFLGRAKIVSRHCDGWG